jgi:phage terminase small subunit
MALKKRTAPAILAGYSKTEAVSTAGNRLCVNEA